MTRKTILFGVWLVMLALPRPSRCEGTSTPSADQFAQRFLTRLVANAPLAGRFEITVCLDEKLYRQHCNAARAAGAQAKKMTKSEPRTQKLSCSWAWDGSREL